MGKTQILDTTFENLADSYINARNRAGASMLEMAIICLRAKEQLKKKKWFEWLDDSRIKLKRTQAKKLIAIAKVYSQGGQSADPLEKKGIEEAYLLTRVKDDSIREELSDKVIEADFTVKQIKQAVSKVQNENKTPSEAIEEVKEMPKQAVSKERKTVSLDEYRKLKDECEVFKKENEELKQKVKELESNRLEANVLKGDEIEPQKGLDLSYLN